MSGAIPRIRVVAALLIAATSALLCSGRSTHGDRIGGLVQTFPRELARTYALCAKGAWTADSQDVTGCSLPLRLPGAQVSGFAVTVLGFSRARRQGGGAPRSPSENHFNVEESRHTQDD